MDVDVDMDDQKRQFKNVIDNFFFFFSGQTVCSVRIEINVLQGNSEITSNLELEICLCATLSATKST